MKPQTKVDSRDAFRDLEHLAPVRNVRMGENPPEVDELLRQDAEARKAARSVLSPKGGK